MADTEWVLRYRGLGPWRAADVTAADALVATELLGEDTWVVLDPTSGPRACVALLSQLIARDGGVPIEHAQAAVVTMPAPEFVGCLSVEPVLEVPADADADAEGQSFV